MLTEFTNPIFNNNVYAGFITNTIEGVLTKPLGYLVITILDAINFLMAMIGKDLSTMKYGIDEESTWYDIDLEYDALLSPDDIFSGKVPAVNANIFNVNNKSETINDVINNIRGADYVKNVKKAVASIYIALRNIAAIILLCLLIYTGIRMVLASNSYKEQSHWRFMLIDWVKALILLIFLHVLMVGIFWISDSIVAGIGNMAEDNFGGSSIVEAVRQAYDDTSIINSGALPFIIIIIMYGYITYYTVVFFIAYFKRFVWTAMLIVISPLVCVTYALGKEKKIFEKWLREYILNVLIQPFHLLIYTILFIFPIRVLSAGGKKLPWGKIMNTGSFTTYIYAILSIAMIRPAEKWFRKLFEMNGDIANMSSFESGKAELDKAKVAAQKIKETVIKVAAVVATGGAAAPAMGATATSAAGAAAPAVGGATQMGIETETAQMGLGAGEKPVNPNMLEGPNVFGQEFDPTKDDYDGENPYDSNFENHANKRYQWSDDFDDYVEVEELDNYEKKLDKLQINQNDNKELDNKNKIENNGIQSDSNSEVESGNNSVNGVIQAIEGAKNEIVGAITNETKGGELILNGKEEMAKGLDEPREEIGANQKVSTLGALSSMISNSATLKQLHLEGAINRGSDAAGKLKERFAGSETLQKVKVTYESTRDKIASTPVGKFGSAVYQDAKAVKGFLDTPEIKSSINELGAALHGVVDGMYIDGAPQDWKPDYEARKQGTADLNKKKLEAFVNNKDNINYIMQMNGEKQRVAQIKDPVKRKQAEKAAKEDAKSFLKSGEPYLKYGIDNVEGVASLIQKQKENHTTPEQTIRDNIRPITNEINVKQQAFAPIQQAVAKETGQAVNSSVVLNQTQSIVNQSTPYIQNGNSNPEVLLRLVKLENDLRNGSLGQIASNSRQVMDIDKVIQKALKDNVSKVKLPESKNNQNVKVLNDFINNAIQKEKSKLQTKHSEPAKTKVEIKPSSKKIAQKPGPKTNVDTKNITDGKKTSKK